MTGSDEIQAEQEGSIEIPESAVAEDAASAPEEPDLPNLEAHVDNRALVFEDLRIFFVPVPKAGCTALMWSLAELAGVEPERFYSSLYREVSRSLTIHDLSRWPDEFLYAKLSPERKQEILGADDWLRVTVVRHPFRRLWSAWQSKILLNEPQFTEKFGSQPWFPHSVDDAQAVLKTFRQFLEGLEEDENLVNADVHWAPQVTLTSCATIPYDHIGRVEKMDETVQRIQDHLEALEAARLPDLQRANVTPLPYVDELFDDADVAILGRVFAQDMKEFGYKPPAAKLLQAPCPPAWIETVDAVTPALEELRYRNERVGDLYEASKTRRGELTGRIEQMKERIDKQKGRIEQQKSRIEEQTKRNKRQGELRAEERRRNERLQKRLQQSTKQLKRMKKSASWRYTAPLRRLGRLRRKVLGGRRSA